MVVNRLYYDSADVASSVSLDSDVLRRALINIYSKDFNPVSDIDVNLFNKVWDDMSAAVARGVAQNPSVKPDSRFVDALAHSAEVFSAFKVHRVQRDMARLLIDSNGNLKPFDKWAADVAPIASHQMGAWLQTEYDTAVIRAHQAADWLQFEREKDILPNLKWMPSTSINPGLDHSIYWGVIRPVDDPFWSEHRPGDRWNCKCSLRSTDEPVTPLPVDAVPLASLPQPGLSNNPGTSRQIFSDDHPYFPDNCSACPYGKGMTDSLMRFFGARRKKDCFNCRSIDRRLKLLADPKFLARADYYDLKHDHNYRDVRYDKKSGGVRATHIGHNDNTGRKEFLGGTMSGADLERACVEQLFKAGHKVILCDESKMRKTGEAYSALDMQLDGIMMDIRAITGKGWYWRALLKKNVQLKKYNARPDIVDEAHALCLYFHRSGMFNEDNLLRSINIYKYFYDNSGNHVVPLIKRIYVVINGRNDILQYDV